MCNKCHELEKEKYKNYYWTPKQVKKRAELKAKLEKRKEELRNDTKD